MKLASLTNTFDLNLLNDLAEVQPEFNDTDTISDTYVIDDTTTFQTYEGLEALLNYLLDDAPAWVAITATIFDGAGNLLTPAFSETTGTGGKLSATFVKVQGTLAEGWYPPITVFVAPNLVITYTGE